MIYSHPDITGNENQLKDKHYTSTPTWNTINNYEQAVTCDLFTLLLWSPDINNKHARSRDFQSPQS